MADWSSLPSDLICRVADRFLAADDLDYYVEFRAVCRSWRSGTGDPRADCTNPRFHPKRWAMLKKCDDDLSGNVVVSFVNLGTGRFLCKNIPLLRKYFLVATTDGGLLVLGELEPPYGARVLNPFTGSVAYFSVPILEHDVRMVAVTTSPMMLFISGVRNNVVGWADQNSTRFHEFWVQYPDDLLSMTPFAGDVYVTNRHGSIVSTTDVVVDGGNRRRSPGTITMTTTIPSSSEGVASYYLVESAGELLLVSKRCTAAGRVVALHKVDTVRNTLEPVTSIGSRAIFTSQVRSFSIDADMFPTIEAGCIYFVEPTIASITEHGIVVSSLRLADQSQENIIEWGSPLAGRRFGPSTLVQVLGDYCRHIPISELELILHGRDDDSEGYESDGSS